MKRVKKKAIIFDLDNTIYPVSSIGEQLFSKLFGLIEADGRYRGDFAAVKQALKKRPFQVVAKEFHFDEELIGKAVELLSGLTYEGTINPFEDYTEYRSKGHYGHLKFLVTTGFTKLQWSKIKQMELESDFDACFVVDPAQSDCTKKSIFGDIMEKYKLHPEEVLVVGDDIHSEIMAGRELGIDTLLYDHEGKNQGNSEYEGDIITCFDQLEHFI